MPSACAGVYMMVHDRLKKKLKSACPTQSSPTPHYMQTLFVLFAQSIYVTAMQLRTHADMQMLFVLICSVYLCNCNAAKIRKQLSATGQAPPQDAFSHLSSTFMEPLNYLLVASADHICRRIVQRNAQTKRYVPHAKVIVDNNM